MADTILLVEDEPLVRLAIASHLEDCGYHVLQAESADEALIVLLKHPEIGVVFTDVRMSGRIDGLGLAKWVVEHRPRIAVMVASGDTAKDTVLKELCGAQAFLKPYNFDEVTQHIRQAIHARRVN
jgi:DNA-binding NtrC family response regulator